MARREKRGKSRGSVGNNRKMGEDFLEKNRKKEGIRVTDSGLQYQIIEEGAGKKPDENMNVTVHQRVMVLNGSVIGDTFKDNMPEEVAMSEMIEGYREGLLMMKKGARYKFWIPPEFAWGKKGTGTKIPPEAVLIFDVRLIDFW